MPCLRSSRQPYWTTRRCPRRITPLSAFAASALAQDIPYILAANPSPARSPFGWRRPDLPGRWAWCRAPPSQAFRGLPFAPCVGCSTCPCRWGGGRQASGREERRRRRTGVGAGSQETSRRSLRCRRATGAATAVLSGAVPAAEPRPTGPGRERIAHPCRRTGYRIRTTGRTSSLPPAPGRCCGARHQELHVATGMLSAHPSLTSACPL